VSSSDRPRLSALLIEDSEEMRLAGRRLLQSRGFEVAEAEDGERGLALARELKPDLVLLDLGLPRLDGLEVCRRLRAFSDAYIVIVTGREHELDKIEGLTVGADDYVTKPYSPRELGARIEAMLRRPRTAAAPVSSIRVVGDVTVDIDARTVRVGERPVALTRTEFDLLSAMSERPGGVLTRETLLERVWGPNWFGDAHVVDVHVSNLRRKLAGASARVQTVRGVGFRLLDDAG
jgi:DNA-binding response OmpR family regulator